MENPDSRRESKESMDLELEQCRQELKRVQEQCVKAQKLALVGNLAGGIAHNFNNLLMGIQGNAGLLRTTMDPDDPKAQKIERILGIVDEGSAIVRELLGFARSDTVSPGRQNINIMLKSTVAMFNRTRKELEIQGDYAPDLWRAEVDRSQMVQLFLNLLINASQAISKTGSIVITTCNRVLGPGDMDNRDLKTGNYIMVSVRDSGSGMTDEVRDKAFQPFFTSLPPGKGYGLGLTTVQDILSGCRGFALIHDTSSDGTTVHVFLPAQEESSL